MNEQIQLLNKAWADWKDSNSSMNYSSFGPFFIDYYTQGYKNHSILHETNNDKAYTELLWEIASGELDNKIVSEYTTKTNQKGSA